jgi:murein L,D-transpeptidase YcbB/YkuD
VADPIPLHWTYITAWSTTDGIVNFRNDIYNLDGLDQLTAEANATPVDAAAAPAPISAMPTAATTQ